LLRSSLDSEQLLVHPAKIGHPPARRSYTIAGVELDLSSDSEALLNEFASVFGDHRERAAPVAFIRAEVRGTGGPDHGTLRVSGDDLTDPAGFLLGLASPTVPMVSLPSTEPSVQVIGLANDAEPLFIFRDGEMAFRKVPRWERIVSHVLFLRMLRMRPDLLFFHAASVVVDGRGVLLVGPKGSGKSTLSLALAARGHALLGDETAAYQPSTVLLLPMPRPVGIKPGVRAKAIGAALDQLSCTADPEGIFRVPIERLLATNSPTPARLRGVVFLRGFGPEPRLTPISAGREELAQMQPLATTTSGNTTMKVFEMIRLLGSVVCNTLTAGDPDATANYIEEAIRQWV
jgi:hypothetical protein